MPDPSPDRYKAEMPEIPGVSGAVLKRLPGSRPGLRFVAGLIVVVVLLFVGLRWALHYKRVDLPSAQPLAQIDVPAPPPDPSASLPHATEGQPGIATIADLARPWAYREFFVKNRLTGENIPAAIIRLPGAPGNRASAYWAFSLKSPYGNCKMEYISDLSKLQTVYGYKAAKHPMVGNPCSNTLFDPLRMTNLPGNVWVRGAIVQGSALRPPLGVEVRVQGKEILATRTE